MKKSISLMLFIALFLIAIPKVNQACTNFLITKGASTDGSTMISYAADSHVLYGELYHWEAATYPEGTMLDIYEWDTGKFLGKIKQAKQTYNVAGNMNEHQVAIGETTYGGRKELAKQSGAIMDYGSLIYVALQRSKTAREAIKIMTDLVAEYGYYSSGESFSISDPNEVWIMELIGKGEGHKGAVWVALKIPDGYVSGHANQARIQTFPLNDPDNCIYAEDVISFARDKGWYDGKDKKFSFSDTYAPVDFGGARFCEARVWSMFRDVNSKMDKYEAYAMGHDLDKRMPLWIKPDRKVSLQDMFRFMRNTFEGTVLDMSKDIGAGPFGVPYRWRPLTWKVDGDQYCNERAVATQQTGFSFIAQARDWMPNNIGGIIWWGVDDAGSTVYMPIYSSITKVPHCISVGNGSMMEFSESSAFWLFNQVSNLAYTRYNYMIKDVQAVQLKLEADFIKEVESIDKAAKALNSSTPDLAVEYITDYSAKAVRHTMKSYKQLYAQLFTKYMDGNVKYKQEVPEGYKYVNPKLEQPGYDEQYYKNVVKDTGKKLKMKGASH